MDIVRRRERLDRLAQLPLERIESRVGLFKGTSGALRELWQRRELVVLLSRREIKARYKDSALGPAWSLVRPVAQLLVYYFAIGQVLGVARSIPSFAIFVFIGLTGWGLYTEIVQRATVSIVENAGLVKKVYLPREVFPLSGVASSLFNFGIQLIVLVVAMVALGELPHVDSLGYALFGIVNLLVLGAAFALLLSALNVFMRDIQHLVEVAFVVLFWASPIVYSYTFVEQLLGGTLLEKIYLANPVTVAIIGLQRGLWRAGQDDPQAGVWPENLDLLLVIGLVGSLIFLWFSHYVFTRLQGNFAQEV